MKTGREKINESLKSVVVPFLRDIGFKGSFPYFKRVLENRVDLLMFQFEFGTRFVVEIAKCPPEGIVYANGKKRTTEKIKVYHLLGRDRRVRIPTNAKSDLEKWIDYEGKNTDKIAKEVVELIKKYALPWWEKGL